jgi:hypothetical protein
MELLTAKRIKKIVYGISLSDAHITERGRLDFYSKHEEYASYIAEVLQQITGSGARLTVKHDKRGYIGYRATTKQHSYFSNMRDHVYGVRKHLTRYNVSRIDEEALAHIYMCDGYTAHSKNHKKNKVQNIGWFCLEAFPREELQILQEHLLIKWGIESSLVKVRWGYGYRIRVGGLNLQKLISVIYPFILDCFKYKVILFYRGKGYVDMILPNAEQYIVEYTCIEDIVRHPLKSGQT